MNSLLDLFLVVSSCFGSTMQSQSFSMNIDNVKFLNIEEISNQDVDEYIKYYLNDDNIIVLTNSLNKGNKNYDYNDVTIYYKLNGITHSFYYDSTSFNIEDSSSIITSKVNSILEEKQNYSQNIKMLTSNANQNLKRVWSSEILKEHKPYGYFSAAYNIYEYAASDKTGLFFIETNADFVPGSVASKNNLSGYEKKWKLESGYMHLKADQTFRSDIYPDDVLYGGIPIFKDAAPYTSEGTITLTSSYDIGLTFGKSFTNGFSFDGISIEDNTEIGLNISFSYSKAYTTSEPFLNAFKSTENNEFIWSFDYAKAREQVYSLRSTYIYEMNKDSDLFGDEVRLWYDFQMNVENVIIFDIPIESHTVSYDLLADHY